MTARNSHRFPTPTAYATGVAAESSARGLLESKDYRILLTATKPRAGKSILSRSVAITWPLSK